MMHTWSNKDDYLILFEVHFESCVGYLKIPMK